MSARSRYNAHFLSNHVRHTSLHGWIAAPRELKTFSVKCAAEKKATSGGFKWTGANPPGPGGYEFLDSYPNGGGFVVRIYIEDGGSAENEPLSVYSNCVKSRKQDGTPPA